MRILHVVPVVDDHSSYGGPLAIAVNQCRELRRRGHDAQLAAGWAGTGPPPDEVEGIPAQLYQIRNVVPGMRRSGEVAPELLSWLRSKGASFDAAHLHLTRDLLPLMAGFWLRRAEVPYVTQTYGMDLADIGLRARALDRTLTLRVLRDARRCFVLSRTQEQFVTQLAGPVPIESLPNGIAPQTRSFTVPRQPGQELSVVFLGRLTPGQHVMEFALAAATLIREGSPAQFSVVGPDDADRVALDALIRSDGLAGRLVYEGPLPRDRHMERLARADVYVDPSPSAPFPMTLLEALAAATPSICTSGCGIAPELAADGAALVVAPGHAAIAAGLRTLLSSQRARIALSAAGPATVRDRFSMDQVAEQLIRAYRGEHRVVDLPRSTVTRLPGHPAHEGQRHG